MTVAESIEFRILGPIETVVGGRSVPLGGAKQRALLAALLLRANEVVSVDELVDAMWGEHPPERAPKTVQVYVWQLRKLLGHDVVRTQAPGYSVMLGPGQLDLERFESLRAAARAAPPLEAARLLRDALGLFRGRPLADVAYERFAAGEIARIEELRLQAIEERIAAELALGGHPDLAGELESLVAENPLRERLRAQLMLTLYRAGRQAEALAAYQETRRLLVEELGIEPSRELQALQGAILRQDPALDAAPADEPVEELRSSSDAETARAREARKMITVLAAAIASGARSSRPVDPEDARAALRPFQAAATHEVESRGGEVANFTGDAVVAVWGRRVTHEDDAERAVRAALALRDWVAEQGSVRIWIGIDTGVAIVSPESSAAEAMAAVDVATAAQRLQETAADGAIHVGTTTYRATRDRLQYRPVAPIVTRGRAGPIPAWELARLHPGSVAPGRSSPFVGRHLELELLLTTLARAHDERAPQLVTLVGEAGIGKSRLLAELSASVVEKRPSVTWRQGRCLPYGDGVSLWALGEIVKAQAGILESDRPREAAAKLAAAVAELVADSSEREWISARLGPLVGARILEGPGASERAEAFAAWRRFLEALAEQEPAVLVFEDFHWADETLLDFVDELTRRTREVPLFVACTARHELLTRRPGWGGGRPNSSTISLPPLRPDETAVIVAAAADHSLSTEVEQALLGRAAGNPLYAEQLARALAEGSSVDEIPETVHGIIAARLDALPMQERELLHDAAVVGKIFWLGALKALGDGDRVRVEELLETLQGKEFVQRGRRSSITGDDEYAFRHALLRDVAYEQIPRSARAAKHRLTAGWIERIAEGTVTDHAEILAHHYARALDLARASGSAAEASELEAPTRRFLVLAGERAFALDASRAETYYGQALELLPHGEPARARVLARAADVAWQTGRFEAAEQRYEEAISELSALGDDLAVGDALIGLAHTRALRGDTARANAHLATAVKLLEQKQPGRELADAYAQLARERTLSGSYREGLDWAEKARALADRLRLASTAVVAGQYRGFARCHLGDLEGLSDLRAALDAGIALGLGQECVRAHVNLGYCIWLMEGPAAGLSLYRAGVDYGTRRGLDAMVIRSACEMPWLLFDLGEWNQLLRTAEEALKWERRHGGSYVGITPLTYRALVLLYRGAIDEAATAGDEFATRARDVREPQLLAPALAVAARVEQALGHQGRAVALVEELEAATRHDPVSRLNHVAEATRVCAAAGELALAARLQDSAPPPMARQRHALASARAIVREATRDHEEAAALYDDAARVWKGFGHVLEHAQALLGLGRCRVALGQPDAQPPLAAAAGAFARLGARPLAQEADALLERASSHDAHG